MTAVRNCCCSPTKSPKRCLFSVVLVIASVLLVALIVVISPSSSNETSSTTAMSSSGASSALPTQDVAWVHAQGRICLRERAVQFVEYQDDAIAVQEIIGTQLYSYNMVNTNALHREVAGAPVDAIERVETGWIDDLAGWKYNCVVEELEDDAANGSDIDKHDEGTITMNDLIEHEPKLVHRNETDGTSRWRVGAWTIEADSDLSPRTLSSEDDEDDFMIDIIGIEPCYEPIRGCDPVTEAAGASVPVREPSLSQIDAVLAVSGIDREQLHAHYGSENDPYDDEDDNKEKGGIRSSSSSSSGKGKGKTRKLNVWVDFQNLVTAGVWCGAGTSMSLPCPGPEAARPDMPFYDIEADRACRRHDHATRFEPVLGTPLTRTECLLDQDLILASDSPAMEAVFGRYGLSGTWGCYGYGPYNCWKRNGFRLSYGCHCSGERLRFGVRRYENNMRNPEWGYFAPQKTCSDDLWSCSGPNTCETIAEPKAAEGSCS